MHLCVHRKGRWNSIDAKEGEAWKRCARKWRLALTRAMHYSRKQIVETLAYGRGPNFEICNPGLAKNDVYALCYFCHQFAIVIIHSYTLLQNGIAMPTAQFPLVRPILGVCMSDPEEDLDQGGRFLLR